MSRPIATPYIIRLWVHTAVVVVAVGAAFALVRKTEELAEIKLSASATAFCYHLPGPLQLTPDSLIHQRLLSDV